MKMGFFKKNKELLVCPKCGSASKTPAGHVPRDHVVLAGLIGRPLGPQLHKCNKCGFEGIFVLIEKSKLDDFKKHVKDRR